MILQTIKSITLIGLLSILIGCSDQTPQSKTNQSVETLIPDDSAQNVTVTAAYDEPPLGRLNKNWVPKHYQLDLTINPDEADFSGEVKIDLTINQARNHYFLHGNLLKVSSVSVTDEQGKLHQGEYTQVDKSGVARIAFKDSLPAGNAVLNISYKAPFNEALEGLYRVVDGGLNYAFTQFEATSARLAFPGFDEPAFKVKFDVSITVPAEMHAIANTLMVKKDLVADKAGYAKATYATTEPLPTYLLAFAVGEFDVVEWADLPTNEVRDRPVPLRGIATKGKGKDFEYALSHTQEILEVIERYFEIPYPYDKLDIIAVPDFNAGAMENAGAITYREQLLLLGDAPSVGQIKSYASVHAHELGHQWFGNYVTPYWWDDIWLNEAFATWITSTTLQTIYPNIGYEETILRRALGAMRNDSLESARQIRQPIKSNHDIASAFDGITYSKGGGVLEMMHQFIGPEDFRAGLQHYMKRHAWKNATADDFIAAISEKAQNVPLEKIKQTFGSFLEQTGIPMLSVNVQCEDGQNTLQFEQSRYFPAGSQGDSNKTWDIPACFNYQIKGEQHEHCELLSEGQGAFTLPGSGCAAYVMPNAKGAGYYRFSVKSGWNTFYENRDSLSTKEMMSINDSFFAALDADQVSLTDFFAVAPQLTQADNKQMIEAPMSVLRYLDYRIVPESDQAIFEKVAQELYQGALENTLNKKQLSDTDIELKKSLISFMAKTANDTTWRSNLADMAKKYTGFEGDGQINGEDIDANLIGTAMSIAGEDLGADFHQHVVGLLKSNTGGTIRGRLLTAIAATKDEATLAGLRDMALSDDVRLNEVFTILSPQIANPKVQDDLWQWTQANIDAIKLRFPTWAQGRLPAVGSGFCEAKKRDELKAFFEPIVESLSGGPRYLAQTIESIDQCIAKKARLVTQWGDWKGATGF
ncbi:M1 family metallopeptidase [Marinicella rhabdoformis]|uniref:M1 family metallopeptidase n=1 Tax=Marinicella rhabdoformis TaxID=2580566 RepID=UPI0012AED4D5|nr:M1 family metallopeptidase [Marinicella rhabdoformis]